MSEKARIAVAATGTLLLLAACGGGSSDAEEPPQHFTIGGVVSGLQGELILQLNGGQNLSLAADGAFNFSDLMDEGANYEVTAQTVPRGQRCEVSNASGTVAANVTDVAVECSRDPSAFYTVFTAAPDLSVEGSLYAIYSRALDSDPVRITESNVDSLGHAIELSVDGSGRVSPGNPHSFLYAAEDASGDGHLWGLDLTGASDLVPRQLSNFTLGAGQNLQACVHILAYENLADPESAFVLIRPPPASSSACNAQTDHEPFVLVHLSDSPVTPAVILPIRRPFIQPLYAPDGTLSGFLAIDDTGHFNFYPDETFTQPTVLATDVTEVTPIPLENVSPLLTLSATPSFVFVNVHLQGGSSELHRVAYTGTISAPLYTFQDEWIQPRSARDANHLYFSAYTDQDDFTAALVKVPLDGTTQGEVLYSEGPVTDGSLPYSIVGLIGGQLILQRPVRLQGLIPAKLATLDTDGPATPVSIFTDPDLIEATVSDDLIFVTVGFQTDEYASAILHADGTAVQPLTSGSAFFTPQLLVRNITDELGAGGGTLNKVTLDANASPVLTAITSADGSPYSLPGSIGLPNAYAITDGFAVGSYFLKGGSTASVGLAFDLDANFVVPYTLDGLTIRFR